MSDKGERDKHGLRHHRSRHGEMQEDDEHRHHSRRHHRSSKDDGKKHHRRHRRHHRHHRRHRHHHHYDDDDEFKDVEDVPPEPPQERGEPANTLRPFHEYPHMLYAVGQYRFDLYECLKPTGEILGYGAFAVVIRVNDTRWEGGPMRKLAVKKNFNAFQTVADARKLLRELMILKHFTDHPHDSLMGLHGVVVPPENERLTFDSICLIMSQEDSNLGRVIEHKMELSPPHIASIVYQILSGVRALHAAGIIHRDLKPDNILINSNCKVKVIDYNMSREIPAEDDGVLMSDVVVARWYRAPEIVLTKGGYNEKIDLWSVGCIMAEIYLQAPIFATASNSLELIRLIMQLLGTPRGDLSWITRVEESGFSYREYVENSNYEAPNLAMVFEKATPIELEVLSKLLTINPETRLSAAEAMRLPFFGGQRVRGRQHSFEMPPYVKKIMYGEVTTEELRDVMYHVLCNFNRTVLGNGDRSAALPNAKSAQLPTVVRASRKSKPPVVPFTP